MTDFGLVSIISPTYNCGHFISETINSVLSQSYENWEMIIIDDNSSDNTPDIVKQYTDNRIRYFRNETNEGAALSRNKALKESHGRWIAFLDCDDMWLPDKLKRQLGFMVANNYHFSYHSYSEVAENGSPLEKVVSGKKRVTNFDMHSCCWPGCLTVMYDSDFIGPIQIKDIKKNNDTALWLKVIKKSDCFFLDENLAKYRRRNGSTTPSNIFSRIWWHYCLFHYAEEKNWLVSLFWMCANIAGNSFKKIFYIQKG